MIKPVLAIFASFVAAVVLVFNPELVRAGIGWWSTFVDFLHRWQTLAAGTFAILAAGIGWFAIQRQIAAARGLERTRLEAERRIFAASLLAELGGIFVALGTVNEAARQQPAVDPLGSKYTDTIVQLFHARDTGVFRATAGELGRLENPGLMSRIVRFYSMKVWFATTINSIENRPAEESRQYVLKWTYELIDLADGIINDLQEIRDGEPDHN